MAFVQEVMISVRRNCIGRSPECPESQLRERPSREPAISFFCEAGRRAANTSERAKPAIASRVRRADAIGSIIVSMENDWKTVLPHG